MPLGRAGLLVAAVTLWLPGAARAENATDDGRYPVALEYIADPTCPESEVIKAIVVERLGYDPFRQDAPNRVLVRLERAIAASRGGSSGATPRVSGRGTGRSRRGPTTAESWCARSDSRWRCRSNCSRW